MKKRNDFVSNSSSSSFIVIKEDGPTVIPNINKDDFVDDDGVIALPNSLEGQIEFGWQREMYDDFWSKLNWAALIAISNKDVEKWPRDTNCPPYPYKTTAMEDLLKMICKKELGIDVRLRTDEEVENIFAYIDHQSNITEKISNAAMFDSYTAMYNWLFRKDSFIQCGNDNK